MINVDENAWYVIELKGYRRRAGQMQEVEYAGVKWVRIDLPVSGDADLWATEHYHPSAIYSFRVVTQAEAFRIARELVEAEL